MSGSPSVYENVRLAELCGGPFVERFYLVELCEVARFIEHRRALRAHFARGARERSFVAPYYEHARAGLVQRLGHRAAEAAPSARDYGVFAFDVEEFADVHAFRSFGKLVTLCRIL